MRCLTNYLIPLPVDILETILGRSGEEAALSGLGESVQERCLQQRYQAPSQASPDKVVTGFQASNFGTKPNMGRQKKEIDPSNLSIGFFRKTKVNVFRTAPLSHLY